MVALFSAKTTYLGSLAQNLGDHQLLFIYEHAGLHFIFMSLSHSFSDMFVYGQFCLFPATIMDS